MVERRSCRRSGGQSRSGRVRCMAARDRGAGHWNGALLRTKTSRRFSDATATSVESHRTSRLARAAFDARAWESGPGAHLQNLVSRLVSRTDPSMSRSVAPRRSLSYLRHPVFATSSTIPTTSTSSPTPLKIPVSAVRFRLWAPSMCKQTLASGGGFAISARDRNCVW